MLNVLLQTRCGCAAIWDIHEAIDVKTPPRFIEKFFTGLQFLDFRTYCRTFELRGVKDKMPHYVETTTKPVQTLDELEEEMEVESMRIEHAGARTR